MQAKHIRTSYGVRPGDHYNAFQWLPLASNEPTEISPEVLATPDHQGPLLCLMGVGYNQTHTSPSRRIELQHNPHHRLVR
jgi:hypothetical protein